METVLIDSIHVGDRIRKEVGNIDAMANSIKEYGIIQPIVITDTLELVVGERRLRALKRLSIKELRHGIEFIWSRELRDVATSHQGLRRVAIEVEENLKRKELTWQEQLEGKKKLLKIMQEIYGSATTVHTRDSLHHGHIEGFGVNKLASMLGESKASTSRDLQIADFMEKIPSIRKAETKESAFRQLRILGAVAQMKISAKGKEDEKEKGEKPWKLYKGDFRDNIKNIEDETVDLIYTDLPFGVSLSQMSKHKSGTLNYADDRASIVDALLDVSREAYRILRPDRYAVFWFGFNYYQELLNSLGDEGFKVNPIPFIWYKHSRSTENPNTRYANAYDSGLVVSKGSPVFIRPGQTNLVDIPMIAPGAKLQIAQQPVELVEKFIKDMTSTGATIVDLMAGSGTTGVAAVRNGRKVIMFEKEPGAYIVAKARMEAL